MNTIKGAIFDKLRNDGSVNAIVGQQIYPSPAPRGVAPPYISFQRIDKIGPRHLLGPSKLARARFQINSWARGPDDADALAEAVRKCLDGLIRVTVGTVAIDTIAFQSQRDSATDPTDANEEIEHVCMQDYMVNYREEWPAHVGV